MTRRRGTCDSAVMMSSTRPSATCSWSRSGAHVGQRQDRNRRPVAGLMRTRNRGSVDHRAQGQPGVALDDRQGLVGEEPGEQLVDGRFAEPGLEGELLARHALAGDVVADHRRNPLPFVRMVLLRRSSLRLRLRGPVHHSPMRIAGETRGIRSHQSRRGGTPCRFQGRVSSPAQPARPRIIALQKVVHGDRSLE